MNLEGMISPSVHDDHDADLAQMLSEYGMVFHSVALNMCIVAESSVHIDSLCRRASQLPLEPRGISYVTCVVSSESEIKSRGNNRCGNSRARGCVQ